MPSRSLLALPLLALALAAGPAAAEPGTPADTVPGSWRALDDPNVTRRFAADGTTAEAYDGETLAEGTWEIADDCADAPPSRGPKLVVRYADDPEPFCYGVASATPDRLELIYFPRGNSLLYERVAD